MNDKNKKFILKLIVIFAIVIATTSLFLPFTSFDLRDYYKENGINYDAYWKYDMSYVIYHFSTYDNTIEAASNYDKYVILTAIPISETGQFSDKFQSMWANENIPNSSITATRISSTTILILFLFLFSFLSYQSFKYCILKKTRYLFYSGVIILIGVVCLISYAIITMNIIDSNNFGYNNYRTYGPGFYLMIVSIILFFIAHLMQTYFLKLPEKIERKSE
jgi:hypothetical protein